MKIQAYAKLNLTLDVIGKRPDGYHEISSFMQSFSLYDDIAIEITESAENEVALHCKGSYINCEHDKNLCFRAAVLFLETFGIHNKRVEITIEKRIPIEAGLGGGSTDGAAVVKLLARHFAVEDKKAIAALCLKLGADVPFFLEGGLQKAGGVGEQLQGIERPFQYWIVVAKPEQSVRSSEIYSLFDELPERERQNENFTGQFERALHIKTDILPYIGNALQKATVKQCGAIGKIIEQLLAFGAGAASMTGSGTAVFGLFDDYAKAVAAENYLKKSMKFSGLFEFL